MTALAEHRGELGKRSHSTLVYADDLRPAGESGLDGLRRAVCADALVRFLRNGGYDVRFALGAHLPESDEGQEDRVRDGFDGLELDYDQVFRRSDPESRLRLQALFLDLLAGDLVYPGATVPGDQASSSWFLRSNESAAWCEKATDRMGGTAAAREAQRNALGRVEGIELTVTLLGAGDLVVFTAHPDSVGDAQFVAVSPRHPEIRSIASQEAIEALSRDSGSPRAIPLGLQAAVPGAQDVLPVVLTAAVEPLALAALGVPSRDAVDSSIAERLQKAHSLAFRAGDRASAPKPVTRYRLPDLPVSRAGAEGTAVPILRCGKCGPVPAPKDQLPFTGSWDAGCPDCGGESKPEPQVLSPRFEEMWMWALAEPGLENAEAAMGDGHAVPWLVIVGNRDGRRLVHQCLSGELLRKIGALPEEEPANLLKGAAAVGGMKEEGGGWVTSGELGQLTASKGADAIRFALLDMAAPATATGLSTHSVTHAARFVDELRRYAGPRLSAYEGPDPPAVDPGTRVRRRLRAWCRAAAERIDSAFTEMEFHHATHNRSLFLRRIEDFEQRAEEDGPLGFEDRQAVVFALRELIRLASPCVPAVAADLGGGG